MRRLRPIDRLDIGIMSALERDGRMTKAALSEAVSLSPTPCGARVAKLETAGYIRGYHADVDVERIGDLSRFSVIASVQQWTPERARRFEAMVATIPQIFECDAVFGTVDFVMSVYAADEDQCRELIMPLLPIGLDCVIFPVLRSVRGPRQLPLTALLDEAGR